MNCQWFERRLDELLDERLPPDGDLDLCGHAERCSRCARLLADHLALLDAVQVLAWPEACEGMAGRVLAAAARETQRPKPQASFTPNSEIRRLENCRPSAPRRGVLHWAGWIVAATAAALLIGVGIAHWSKALNMPKPKLPTAPLDAVANLKPAADRTAARADEPAIVSIAGVPSFAGLLSPQQRILVEQVSDGLKPVTHSMSAALHALRRTLPGSEAPARSS